MTKDDVEKTIRPYAARLRECIVYGHAKWQEFGARAGDLRAPLDARARACFISRHISAKVAEVFAEINAVRVVDVRGFVELVLLKARLVIRFKKLDRRGQSRNILTPAQHRWFEGQAKLPEMPPRATRLIAGYVLDEITANLDRVLVTLPNGPSAVMWRLELPETGEMKVIEMPRGARESTAPRVRSRIKKTKDEEEPHNDK